MSEPCFVFSQGLHRAKICVHVGGRRVNAYPFVSAQSRYALEIRMVLHCCSFELGNPEPLMWPVVFCRCHPAPLDREVYAAARPLERM
jgi:hypothetical protein